MNESAFVKDVSGCYTLARPVSADEVVGQAEHIIKERVVRMDWMSDPTAARKWLATKLAGKEHEVFGVIYLNTRHQVLAYDELFRGTIDGCSVPPREVVKEALRHNAAQVILFHNHPSGIPEPSDADKRLTQRLKAALGTVDIRVLDHIVVGGGDCISFSERGLL